MMKLVLGALLIGLVGCGGSKDNPMLIDSGMDSNQSTCNPVAQTGCAANEKCTWITDQTTPNEVGHIGCAPTDTATAAIGDACVDVGDKGNCSVTTDTECTADTECPSGETCVGAGPAPGATGFDNCVGGAICIAHVCESICDPQMTGTASGCDTNHACGRYSGLFDMGGTLVAGACDPLCDIFSQELFDGTPACGSTDPAAPNLGCYPNSFFQTGSCAPVRSDDSMPTNPDDQQNIDGIKHLDRVDRVKPLVNSAGDAFKNGCAPGYLALYFESDTSMKALCTGICAPLTDGLNSAVALNGQNADKEFGDPTIAVKLPRSAAPAAGDGLCKINLKGSVNAEPENCVYAWGLFLNDDGTVDPMDTEGEKYGFCFPHTVFHYDSDGDGTDDTVFPNFKDLPLPSGATPGTFPANADDVCDFIVTRNTTGTKAQCGAAFQSNNTAPMKQMFRLGVGKSSVATRH